MCARNCGEGRWLPDDVAWGNWRAHGRRSRVSEEGQREDSPGWRLRAARAPAAGWALVPGQQTRPRPSDSRRAPVLTEKAFEGFTNVTDIYDAFSDGVKRAGSVHWDHLWKLLNLNPPHHSPQKVGTVHAISRTHCEMGYLWISCQRKYKTFY